MYASRGLTLIVLIVSFAQLSVALIGDTCTAGQCLETDATCFNNRCVCIADSVATDDRRKCVPVAQTVGVGCETNLQCTTKLSNLSYCNMTHFQCACQPGALPVNGNRWCSKKSLLSESCLYDEQCSHISQATCDMNSFNKLCICPKTHVPSFNNSACLQLPVTWMSDCEESIQCSRVFGDNSICKINKCGCKESYHPGAEMSSGPVSPTINSCIPDRGLTESCTRNDECFMPKDGDHQNVECFESMCRCKDGKAPSDDKQSCNGASTWMVSSLLLAAMIALTTSLRG